MITGQSHWAHFGYDVCPSISISHPAHHGRLRNGNPVLPLFNTWAADLETVHFCCTSGHCDSCRDSQAVFSWLMVSPHHFLDDSEQLWTWVQIAESYLSQFIWSPFHPLNGGSRNIGGTIAPPAARETVLDESLEHSKPLIRRAHPGN